MFISQNNNINHNYFMSLALKQAQRSLGNTNDNPSVGCVIVKDNSIISVGNTSVTGRPHAEFNAIINCRNAIRNSDLYVTLEPCSHYGKTPPCVDKIIKSKIKKVFFSVHDPDIRSYKKSLKLFNKKSIKTYTGINSSKIRDFYRSYFTYKKKSLPFVTLKLAVSKDFYTVNKKKKWITNFYSRSRVHLLRASHDCIVTSSQTVMKDNPLLNCRIEGLKAHTPTRIILDKNLKISMNSKIIKDNTIKKPIIFYNKSNKLKIKSLKKKNIKLIKISLDINNNLNLEEVLVKIKKLGFSRVFLECGKVLSTAFLKKKLVNDFKIFVSNDRIKKNGLGNVKNYFNTYLKEKIGIVEKVNLFGEKLISYKIK